MPLATTGCPPPRSGNDGVVGFLIVGNGMFGAAMGVGGIIITPIISGVIGFIGGVIGAAVYNVIANIVGGIQIDIS